MDTGDSLVTVGAWLIVGVLVGVTALFMVSLPYGAIVTVPLIWLLGRALTRRGLPLWSYQQWPILTGASILMFVLAYGYRHGPGTYCSSTGDCADGLPSPLPFLTIAVVMVVVGVAGFLVGRLRHRANA